MIPTGNGARFVEVINDRTVTTSQQKTRRAQIVYDIAIAKNLIGIAGVITDSYPGVIRYVEPALTGPALEQQIRAQQPDPQERLINAVMRNDVPAVQALLRDHRNEINLREAFLDAIQTGNLEMIRLVRPERDIVTIEEVYDDTVLDGENMRDQDDVPLFAAVALDNVPHRAEIVQYFLNEGDPYRSIMSQITHIIQVAEALHRDDIADLLRDYAAIRIYRERLQRYTNIDDIANLHQALDQRPDIGINGSFDFIIRHDPSYPAVRLFFDRGYTLKESLYYFLPAVPSINVVNLFLQHGMIVDTDARQYLTYHNLNDIRDYIQDHPDGRPIDSEYRMTLPVPKCCSSVYDYAYYGFNNRVRSLLQNGRANNMVYDAVRGAIAGGNFDLVREYVPSRIDANAHQGNLIAKAAGTPAKGGAPGILQYLLYQGADLNRYGKQALEEAARTGNITNIEILLNAGVDANDDDAIKVAALLDNVESLTLLFNRANYNQLKMDSLLLDAANGASARSYHGLLENGADAMSPSGREAQDIISQVLARGDPRYTSQSW